MIFAVSESPLKSTIWPAAAETPGSARTLSSVDAGTVGVLDDQSSRFLPETTASVCVYELVKIEWNARSIESVST